MLFKSKEKERFHQWRLIDYEEGIASGSIYKTKYFMIGCETCLKKKDVNEETFKVMSSLGLIMRNEKGIN